MTDVRDASLVDFLPSAIAAETDIVALSLAIDPELRGVGADIVEALVLPNIAQLGDDVLNELAWAMRLDELQVWDTATVEGKRALLADIFVLRKKSGTRYALRRLFSLIEVLAHITEWWEESPPAAAYTYRISLEVPPPPLGGTSPGLLLAQMIQVSEVILRFTPTRCQLSELSVESNEPGPLFLAAAPVHGRHVTIGFGV